MTKRDNEKEWTDLGYPKGMGSSKFRLPPPDRDFIRAYHLTSAEHGISNISLRRLKVARFSEINDPFELMPLISSNAQIHKMIVGLRGLQNRNMGLLCFSENWTTPMLWSHYADKHKGICLGFDLKRGSWVQKVIYKEKRPRAKLDKIEDPSSMEKNILDLLLLTKFKGWEYEHEIRKIVYLSKAKKEKRLYFLPFDEDMILKEVILGVRNVLSLEDIRKLTKATNPAAVVFKTRLERKGFRIVGDGNYPPEIPK
ncbi:MAG: DUF2971 domain-containing protein [Thermodesulfobacteriota bacterium]